jgi:hypothetical protein
MPNRFEDLETVKFQEKMKPAARRIYQRIFPGCEIEDLRADGVKVHVLDKEFGIDSLLNFKSGQWISIQEKYRKNRFLKYCDFTQEYMNGAGTQYEAPGEWFKLGAQLYFYGWANANETDFEKWCILDVPKYKLLVECAGGLEKIGRLVSNKKHGKASFYAIPIKKLRPCFLYDYRQFT